jgi:hypothetical protein
MRRDVPVIGALQLPAFRSVSKSAGQWLGSQGLVDAAR